jgi:carbonic anhydrase/acetyltransferase-like protein (isoleucine patch superfamily)
MSGNWLDLSSTSNRYISTYVKGFVDMSGGNLLLRNNNIIVNSGDISLNGRLTVNFDSSLNGNTFFKQNITTGGVIQQNTSNIQNASYISVDYGTFVSTLPRLAVANAFTNDNSFNNNVSIIGNTEIRGNLIVLQNTTLQNFTSIGDVSFGGNLFIGNDVSINDNLFVRGDTSMNSRLFVGSDVSMGGKLFVRGDTSMNSRLFVGSDVSMGGKLFVRGDASFNNNVFVGSDVSINDSLYVKNDVTFGKGLMVATDVSINGKLFIGGDLSLNGNWFFGSDVSASGKLFVQGDGSFNGNLLAGGNVSLNGNVTTGTLPDGAITSSNFDTITKTPGYQTSSYLSSSLVTGSIDASWNDVAISSTGQVIAAVGNATNSNSQNIYISTNYGTSFSNVVPVGLSGTTNAWSNLVMSGNGQVIVGSITTSSTSANSSYLYVSQNRGASFSQVLPSGITAANNVPFQTTTISANGQYILAAANSTASSQNLYVSSNFGSTFNSITPSNPATSNPTTWSSVAMSSDGRYMAGVISNTANISGFVYVSSDYGSTFTGKTCTGVTSNMSSIAVSSNGQIVAATVNGGNLSGNIYISSNYGSTFANRQVITTANVTCNWQKIAMSNDAKYMVAIANGSNTTGFSRAYISKDYGNSFTAITSGINFDASWNDVTMSADGKYILLDISGNTNTNSQNIYYSYDYGSNFYATTLSTHSGTNPYWSQIRVSADGNYWAAGINRTTSTGVTNRLYVSQATISTSTNGGTWSSFTNQPKLLNVQGTINPITLIDNSVLLTAQPALNYASFGQSWSQLTGIVGSNSGPLYTGLYPVSVATSANGQYIITASPGTGQIITSSTYGASITSSFSPTSVYEYWDNIAISSSAQYQTALIDGSANVNGNFYLNNADSSCIYVSMDYGVTYKPVQVSGVTTATSWQAVSVSSTGQYQTAIARGQPNGNVYLSSNYGRTWSPINTGATANSNWSSVAMNATGQYQVVTIANGSVYNTRTYGSSWSAISSVGTANWSSSAVSTTGQYQVVCATGGNIWLSNNFGSSWSQVTGLVNQVTPSLAWNGLAVTSNGQYMLATVYNSRIYYSINYGQTWNQSSSDLQPWSSISVSSTGQFANATSLTGAIYNMTLGFPGTLPASANSSTVTGALTAGSISTNQATVTGALSSGSLSVTAGDSTLNAITAKSGSTGFVGINNSTPAYQLDVNSSADYPVNINQANASPSKLCLRMTSPNNTINTTMFSPWLSTAAFNNITKTNDVGFIWGNNGFSGTGGFVIAPWKNTASGLRIDSTGNIDICGNATLSGYLTQKFDGFSARIINTSTTTTNKFHEYFDPSSTVFSTNGGFNTGLWKKDTTTTIADATNIPYLSVDISGYYQLGMAVNPQGSTTIRMFFRLNDSASTITPSATGIIAAGNASTGSYNTLTSMAKLNKGDKVYYLTNGNIQNSTSGTTESDVWAIWVFGYLVCPS